MEERSEPLVGHQLVLLGVCGDLVRVHADMGNLNGASEVKVVVAEVIGARLKLVLGDTRGVVGNSEEHGLGSGHSGLVRDEVEVIDLVSLLLDERGIDHSARARVKTLTVGLGEESVLNVPVNQAVDDPGLVPGLLVLNGIGDRLHFDLFDEGSHGGSAHAISVDDDLLREVACVASVLTDGLDDEVSQNDLSLVRDHSLLNLLSRLARADV